MPRVTVPEAEAIIGHKFSCLNKGYVMLVDHMGGDISVAQGARVSYDKGFDTFDEVKDRALINYLMAHRHTTPFEQVQIKVEMKLPIFVARQWVRHRTASLNEQSGRYTQLESDFYVPEMGNIRTQSAINKQGAGDVLDAMAAGVFQQDVIEDQERVYRHYEEAIDTNVAKEMARINLPLAIYTKWVWSQNLWNMMHLLSLRMDSHAQYEIRVYANALYEIVKAVAPVSLAAWEEYVYKGARFSRTEMEILRGEETDSSWNIEFLEKKLGTRGAAEFIHKMSRDVTHQGEPNGNQSTVR